MEVLVRMLIYFNIVKNSGSILLESVPLGVKIEDVQHDLEMVCCPQHMTLALNLSSTDQDQVPGVTSIHELHAWSLSQDKAVASAHVVMTDSSLANFVALAQRIGECLHAYGIHSVTLQPELLNLTRDPSAAADRAIDGQRLRRRGGAAPACQIACGGVCAPLTCCG